LNWKAFAGFLALIVVLFIVVGALLTTTRPDELTFFFKADTQGYLVPCGCKTVPAGGLARTKTVLDRLRLGDRQGQVVPVEITHGFADRGPGRELLNEEMGRFYRREGFLVGLGSYDFLLGPKAIRSAAPGVPVLLAGQEGLPGSREFRLGGWGVGPIGKHGGLLRLVVLAETAPGGAPLPDPIRAFADERKAHPADAYLVTGQLSPKTVASILKAAPDVIAVIAQWQSDVTSVPQQAGTRWLLYMGDRGRRSATVDVAWRNGKWSVLPTINYLGPDTPSDPATEKEVTGVLEQVQAVNRAALAKLEAPSSPGVWYVGAEACKACHGDIHKKWTLSPHARATADLAIDHQQENPDCLRCHATGLGKSGGFPQPSVDLSGVQCEACHGPGSGHPPRRLTSVPPSQETCGGCHDRRDSPFFDAQGYWQLVKHP
jgi:hypothetical protein